MNWHESTHFCVEMMNSKRQEKEKLDVCVMYVTLLTVL